MKKHRMIVMTGALVLVAGIALAGCTDSDVARQGTGNGNGGARVTTVDEEFAPAVAARGSSANAARNVATNPVVETREADEAAEFSGTLCCDGDEWYLETQDGDYQLGFGPPSYREETGIVLVDGDEAQVRGVVAEDGEIAVTTCLTGEELYTFRSEEGVPLWSGGAAGGRGTGRGSGAGRGGRAG